jgi:hypothetical protein
MRAQQCPATKPKRWISTPDLAHYAALRCSHAAGRVARVAGDVADMMNRGFISQRTPMTGWGLCGVERHGGDARIIAAPGVPRRCDDVMVGSARAIVRKFTPAPGNEEPSPLTVLDYRTTTTSTYSDTT